MGEDAWPSWYMLVILLSVLGEELKDWPSWNILAIRLKVAGVEGWPS